MLAATTQGIYEVEGGAQRSQFLVSHLTVDGDDWWAVTADGSLYRNGEEVARVADVRLRCVAASGDRVLVGADRARLYAWDGSTLAEHQGFATAPRRDSWHTPWGGPPDVRSLAIDDEGVVFVNVHVGGIVRLAEDRVTPTVDIDTDVHQVVAGDGVVVAAAAVGLGVSSDGTTFEFRTDGLHATYARAVAVTNERVFLTVSHGPGGGGAAVYRGSLEGGALLRCGEGLPERFGGNIDTHRMVADNGRVALAHGDTVYATADGGGSWSQLISLPGEVVALAA